jgi:hypothetical protein
MRPRERGTAGRKISSGPLSPKFVNAGMGPLPGRSVGRKPPSPGNCSGTLFPRADIRRFTPPEPINCAGSVKRSSNERPLYACGGSTRRRMDARTDLRLVEIRERTAAEGHRPRRARASRDTIKDRASIHNRPKTIERRGEAGHWEGDLIICKCTRPVLVLHERKSRVTLAARLTGKPAAETVSAMLAVFGRIDPHLRRSINLRQRHRLRPARPGQDYARHDDLVLRRLCLMAKSGVENKTPCLDGAPCQGSLWRYCERLGSGHVFGPLMRMKWLRRS